MKREREGGKGKRKREKEWGKRGRGEKGRESFSPFLNGRVERKRWRRS